MDGEIKIPIFPLGVVLMPNGLLPLHIFEERYKEMINESLRSMHGSREEQNDFQ